MLQNSINAKMFRSLHAIVARSSETDRYGTTQSIRDFGIPSVKTTNSAATLYLEVKTHGADLIVAEAGLDEKGLIRFVRDIRHGLIGNNPFVSIIIIVNEQPGEDLVRRFMASGVDVILMRTTPPEDLQSKLFDMAHRRKPFTTGTTYIGPERRKGARGGKLFQVPTLLHLQDRRRVHETFRALQTDRAELIARKVFQVVSAPNGGSRLAAGQIHPLCKTIQTILPHTPHKRADGIYGTILQLYGTDGPYSESDHQLSLQAAREGFRMICGPTAIPSLPMSPFHTAEHETQEFRGLTFR